VIYPYADEIAFDQSTQRSRGRALGMIFSHDDVRCDIGIAPTGERNVETANVNFDHQFGLDETYSTPR